MKEEHRDPMEKRNDWMRVYQGIDLVDLGKFKEIFSTSDGLVREVFTEREMEDWRASPSWLNLAGCFAAKEACFKAMGIGLSGSGIDHLFREVELLGGPTKHPELAVHGWLGTLMRRRRIDRWRVSVARCRGAAVAAVVLVGQAAVENSI
jgi:phosphopantetheine--protein transferase-like protein